MKIPDKPLRNTIKPLNLQKPMTALPLNHFQNLTNTLYSSQIPIPGVETWCKVGGCCKREGGQNNTRGSSFCLHRQVENKGPVIIRTLSLPAGRDKHWSPVCCLQIDPYPVYNNHPAYTAFLSWGRCCLNHGLHASKLCRHPMWSPEAFPIDSS